MTTAWKNPLVRKGRLGSPVVEATPFVFNKRLYRLDNMRGNWMFTDGKEHCLSDKIQILDVDKNVVVSVPLVGYQTAAAFAWKDRVYVFAGKHPQDDVRWVVKEIYMTSSHDLLKWTEPKLVLKANEVENLFNVSVCRGIEQFIMLVETDDPQWQPKFTFKYFSSNDLINWKQIDGAIYGKDKYVGGPALYYEDGYYYTLYVNELKAGWDTRIARSRNLIDWQDAPADRPVVSFDTQYTTKVGEMPLDNECNASDVELCEWNGKTLIYFTGGNQTTNSELQLAEFNGKPADFLKHFFA